MNSRQPTALFLLGQSVRGKEIEMREIIRKHPESLFVGLTSGLGAILGAGLGFVLGIDAPPGSLTSVFHGMYTGMFAVPCIAMIILVLVFAEDGNY